MSHTLSASEHAATLRELYSQIRALRVDLAAERRRNEKLTAEAGKADRLRVERREVEMDMAAANARIARMQSSVSELRSSLASARSQAARKDAEIASLRTALARAQNARSVAVAAATEATLPTAAAAAASVRPAITETAATTGVAQLPFRPPAVPSNDRKRKRTEDDSTEPPVASPEAKRARPLLTKASPETASGSLEAAPPMSAGGAPQSPVRAAAKARVKARAPKAVKSAKARECGGASESGQPVPEMARRNEREARMMHELNNLWSGMEKLPLVAMVDSEANEVAAVLSKYDAAVTAFVEGHADDEVAVVVRKLKRKMVGVDDNDPVAVKTMLWLGRYFAGRGARPEGSVFVLDMLTAFPDHRSHNERETLAYRTKLLAMLLLACPGVGQVAGSLPEAVASPSTDVVALVVLLVLRKALLTLSRAGTGSDANMMARQTWLKLLERLFQACWPDAGLGPETSVRLRDVASQLVAARLATPASEWQPALELGNIGPRNLEGAGLYFALGLERLVDAACSTRAGALVLVTNTLDELIPHAPRPDNPDSLYVFCVYFARLLRVLHDRRTCGSGGNELLAKLGTQISGLAGRHWR
ncbi:uncharacterized protein AMSG_08975 [Thecamonas trahens ATCC 50062]|uniref:Uncharacterized protein n=1 Tax=Thecamonas trahens ATCC 50062 TaxID=461836 RepID=A0A0L0DN40_THETB|nr:hypothetical protein AMSG_08975 [Thecamonas trahens ATCC 50062]KNC52833.1 hypothetical protein AMSG_08975 [Thecamonas trahens ATCC 50062]|eukprot:XP_013754938.1 hypothetical protein AMSG_08975 [Thecamonas trahens ATCC 50062]